MKRVFTTMLVSMFCYCAFAQLSVWYNGNVVFSRAYSEIDSITFGLEGTTPSEPPVPSDGSLYTPEQTKNHLVDVAKRMINQFNTADQKFAIDLAEELFVKYKDYDWDDVGEYYEDRYDPLFNMPRYMKGVSRGNMAPSATDILLLVSFPEENIILEADDATRSWKKAGKTTDNSLILRCKDKNGVTVEAKVWGEGATKDYEYTWDEYHWEYPKIYAGDNAVIQSYYGRYNGRYYWFYNDNSGWYYYDDGTKTYVRSMDAVEISEADGYIVQNGSERWHMFYRDETSGNWFCYDYDNGEKVYGGKRTIKVSLPAKVFFTLKSGSTEISRCEFTQEMVKNDHAYFTVYAKLANLSWTTDVKVNSTHATAAFAFNYGSKQFFSGAVNLPVYELIGKSDNQSYEDWIEEYEDRYDELLKKIGEADGLFDIFGEVQIKAHINNFSYAYRDWKAWDKDYGTTHTKNGAKAFCNIFNDNMTNGIYFNNDVKQAEVRVIARYDEIDESYDPEAVLYFPADGSSYGFEQYFDRKPFTGDLRYMVEDLINKYIQMSPSLYDEVGDVSF